MAYDTTSPARVLPTFVDYNSRRAQPAWPTATVVRKSLAYAQAERAFAAL